MHRLRPALVAVLAASGALAGAGPAAADELLVPGGTQTVVVTLPGSWAADADVIAVSADDVVQLENDCIEPEVEDGDDCTDDRGELGDKLVATVAWGRTDDGCRPAVAMARLDLPRVEGPGRSTRFEDVAGAECLVLELRFPDGDSDDVAQSDSLTFSVDAVAEEVPGHVAGTTGSGIVDPAPSPGGTPGREPQKPADGSSPGGASARGQVARGAAAGRGASGGPGGPGAPRLAPAAAAGSRGAPGPMVGRVDAQVSVGADGVSVETRAAETSVPGSAMAWSSLLLGAVALGWVGFVLVRRRRRGAAA